jgi:hypothetical protein
MHSSTGTRLALDTLLPIKMVPIIITHHRPSHAQTCRRSCVAGAFPKVLLQFNEHARNFSSVHHDDPIRLGLVRIALFIDGGLQNVAQPFAYSFTVLVLYRSNLGYSVHEIVNSFEIIDRTGKLIKNRVECLYGGSDRRCLSVPTPPTIRWYMTCAPSPRVLQYSVTFASSEGGFPQLPGVSMFPMYSCSLASSCSLSTISGSVTLD